MKGVYTRLVAGIFLMLAGCGQHITTGNNSSNPFNKQLRGLLDQKESAGNTIEFIKA